MGREAVMQSTAKLLAGAAGLTTAFVAGGLAKDKYNQAKFEKAVPILPRESFAEIAKNKACGAPFQLKAEAGAQAERTFIMIKPDGVQRGLVGEIVKRFEQKGFKLVAIMMMRPGEAHLREHYADLAARPFFPGLVSYMNSGPSGETTVSRLDVTSATEVTLLNLQSMRSSCGSGTKTSATGPLPRKTGSLETTRRSMAECSLALV